MIPIPQSPWTLAIAELIGLRLARWFGCSTGRPVGELAARRRAAARRLVRTLCRRHARAGLVSSGSEPAPRERSQPADTSRRSRAVRHVAAGEGGGASTSVRGKDEENVRRLLPAQSAGPGREGTAASRIGCRFRGRWLCCAVSGARRFAIHAGRLGNRAADAAWRVGNRIDRIPCLAVLHWERVPVAGFAQPDGDAPRPSAGSAFTPGSTAARQEPAARPLPARSIGKGQVQIQVELMPEKFASEVRKIAKAFAQQAADRCRVDLRSDGRGHGW